jgi:hypothetical protein
MDSLKKTEWLAKTVADLDARLRRLEAQPMPHPRMLARKLDGSIEQETESTPSQTKELSP